ncbi:hypothetical protein AB3M92_00605 [Micrococcus luteus]|uniref:hypothetical protein n=1 Tax=Micrococcus luteus TaxID=1270 RepID=UPI00399F929D
MTHRSHSAQPSVTRPSERDRLARLVDAAGEETGAITAEYGDHQSEHPLIGCRHERAPPVVETPRGRGHHA